MDPGDIEKLLSGTVGAVGVLSFFVIMFIRGTIRTKIELDELARDRDYWRSIADRALTAAEKFAPPLENVRRS